LRAYTAVDRAESEAEAARLLNVEGTRNVARACRERGALMVTFAPTTSSTEREADRIGKRIRRTRSPCTGRRSGPPSRRFGRRGRPPSRAHPVAVRPAGKNFIRTILEKARRGETLRVASDQVGCPTFSRDLAGAVRNLLGARARGTVHFSSEGETSWFDLARHVLQRCGLPAGSLFAAATRDLPYPAPRPAYGVLSKEKYRAITGVSPRPWEEAVGEYLELIDPEGGAR